MTTGLAQVSSLRRKRPAPGRPDPPALALLARHSGQILATARRYSVTAEDAEDAYQRGVEILLTKAPSGRESELLPWLKTVVKHEAFAVRRANGRAVPVEDAGSEEPDEVAWTDEHAERYERLRVGAEALAGLKPQEIRCLLLRAEGLSYKEICEVTGWTYTKVNRSITEGRRAFGRRLAGIESGAECERLAPLLSRLADGEADPTDMQRLRPHLRNCLACRATLREYRSAPARAAALVPPVLVAAGMPAGGPLGGLATAVTGRASDALTRLGELFGFASAGKAVAIAASAAAFAGGGAATYSSVHRDPAPVPASAFGPTASGPRSNAEPDPGRRARIAAAAPTSFSPPPRRAASPQPVPATTASSAAHQPAAAPAAQEFVAPPMARRAPAPAAATEPGEFGP